MLSIAASLILGPAGWFLPGPVLPDGSQAWFDTGCAVRLGRQDLDELGGGLAVIRVWGRDGWRFIGDVEPPTGATFVERDAAGLLTAYAVQGRRITVARDPSGVFLGLRDGVAAVVRGPTQPYLSAAGQVLGTEDRWTSTSGGSISLRWSEANLSEVEAATGRTRYRYDAGRLSEVETADGTLTQLGLGTIAVGGSTWRCDADETGRTVAVAGQRWRIEGDRQGLQRVTDPAGTITETRWREGRLLGWTDPGGERTDLTWNSDRLVTATTPAGTWTFGWAGDGLTQVSAPNVSWTMTLQAGVLRSQSDGASAASWAGGFATVSGNRVGVTRDASGRPTTITVGGRHSLRWSDRGGLSALTDGGGGEWRFARDAAGRVISVSDPGGALWRLTRDALGRVVALTDSVGRQVRMRWGNDGLAGVDVSGQEWLVSRDGLGRPTAVADPWGRRWRATRDGMGRVTRLERPDLSELRLARDRRGDLVEHDGVQIRRDGAGRPVRWSSGALSGAWAWGPLGWVGASGPGVGVRLGRSTRGVSSVTLDSGEDWQLSRDGSGRVIAVQGPGAVALTRDGAGRVIGINGVTELRLDRDARGLVSRAHVGERSWVWRRDAAGRVLGVETAGVRLGVDRDVAGRPLLARFTDGGLARYAWDANGVSIVLQTPGGAVSAVSGWSLDALGAVTRLRGDAVTVLQRDPLGVLTVQEGSDVWSRAPDGVEGPRGASLRWDADGLAQRAQLPEGAPPAWGFARSMIAWVWGEDRALTSVESEGQRVMVTHDSAGRLTGWTGPKGAVNITRDALGRLQDVGGEALGWQGLLSFRGSARATVPDVAQARPGGGVIVDSRRVPLLVVPLGAVSIAPSGLPMTAAVGEYGVGGRFQPLVGGPLLGRSDAIDPVSGAPTSTMWPFLGRSHPWEVGVGDDPWPDPDEASAPVWDPAPFGSESAFADPLRLLVEIGHLPDGGPRRPPVPGLPWLPASAAVVLPAPVPDPLGVPVSLPIVEAWAWAHAQGPVTPAEPDSLLYALISGDPYSAHTGGASGAGSDTLTETLLFDVSRSRSWP